MNFEQENCRLKLELTEVKKQLQIKNDEIKNKDEKIKKMEKKLQQVLDSCRGEMNQKDEKYRKIHNQMIDLKGQIRVAVRIRESEGQDHISILNENKLSFSQGGQSTMYQFEHIFEPNMSQDDVFVVMNELILSVIHGYNVCLIAYGPTGTGKTYTMRGEGINGPNEGIIPRSVRFLLQHGAHELATIGWEFRFSASYLEIYNEEAFDLLNKREKLKVKWNDATTNIAGLKKLPVECVEDVELILEKADSERSTAATSLNEISSRSHALFQVHIEGIHSSTGQLTKSCLNLVDLAGSERCKESGATGERFTELTHINKSLFTLKNCIRAQMTNSAHVPYRDTKLTTLLRSYLGAGSSKTMFIAHINERDAAETKRTLEFTSNLRSTNLGKAQAQFNGEMTSNKKEFVEN